MLLRPHGGILDHIFGTALALGLHLHLGVVPVVPLDFHVHLLVGPLLVVHTFLLQGQLLLEPQGALVLPDPKTKARI